MDVELFREYCLSKPHVTEGMPFGEDVLVFKVGGKRALHLAWSPSLQRWRAVQYFAQLHLADVELQCFLRDAKKIIRSVG